MVEDKKKFIYEENTAEEKTGTDLSAEVAVRKESRSIGAAEISVGQKEERDGAE